jgi:ERCC4-related helicase
VATQLLRSLIDLCATFNCSTITSVWKTEHEDELERSAPHIFEDEIIFVDKNKAFDTLSLTIENELKDFILQLFVNKNTNPSQIFPEKDFDMNGYEQNLELLKQSEQKNQNFSFVLLINSILPIYRNIKALNDLTPELVLSDLKDYLEMTYKRREHPIEIDTLIYEECQNLLKKKLTELKESQQNLTNPKLDKLVELLKKHAEKPNSRGNWIYKSV